MTLLFQFFFGTAPNPDVHRLVSGRSENGSRMHPAAISFDSSVSIMSGCLSADAKLRAVWGNRVPLYPVDWPVGQGKKTVITDCGREHLQCSSVFLASGPG